MALISRGIQRSFAAVLLSTSLFAQEIQPERTTAEDHQNMMAQLGIKSLRPAPSGNESAPNQANYDEATANPFPNLPQVLTLENGQEVTTADMWWKQRRPEIVELFEREVLGRVPRNVPKVTWSVGNSDLCPLHSAEFVFVFETQPLINRTALRRGIQTN